MINGFKLKCTLIMECNEKPRLNEVSDAVSRRIIDIPFKSTFVDKDIYDKLKDNQKENIFIVNPYYKSKEFKEKYYSVNKKTYSEMDCILPIELMKIFLYPVS